MLCPETAALAWCGALTVVVVTGALVCRLVPQKFHGGSLPATAAGSRWRQFGFLKKGKKKNPTLNYSVNIVNIELELEKWTWSPWNFLFYLPKRICSIHPCWFPSLVSSSQLFHFFTNPMKGPQQGTRPLRLTWAAKLAQMVMWKNQDTVKVCVCVCSHVNVNIQLKLLSE